MKLQYNKVCKFLIIGNYHFLLSLIHPFKKMKRWKLDVIVYWVIGAGCCKYKNLNISSLNHMLNFTKRCLNVKKHLLCVEWGNRGFIWWTNCMEMKKEEKTTLVTVNLYIVKNCWLQHNVFLFFKSSELSNAPWIHANWDKS